MRSYGELFRTPEFTPLFVAASAQVAASTVSGLGLGTLVFARTGSPLLSALSIFGPSLVQVIGAMTLLSAADRVPARTAMIWLAVVLSAGTAVQSIPGLPVPVIFLVLLGLGALGSLGGGVRYGLLNQILPSDGYLLGRSVFNMASGGMQIVGFVVGGVVIATVSPRGALLVGAALYLASAALSPIGLRDHPPRSAGRPSVKDTWRDNRRLWSSRPRRHLYLAMWVPNGLIVGCESLYVAYDPRHAGLLFGCAAAGMLVGDTLAGRFIPPAWRAKLSAPLRLLLAAPYLVFALSPGLPLAIAAVTVASVGYSGSLLLQERLMKRIPDDLSGHALGLYSAGLLSMQGVGAALAGGVAQVTSVAVAMTVMAVLSLAVTLSLAKGLQAEQATGHGLARLEGQPSGKRDHDRARSGVEGLPSPSPAGQYSADAAGEQAHAAVDQHLER